MENEPISLSDLKLRPTAVFMLNQHGFETVADVAHLSSAEILRLPGMGGSDWRKLAAALGREPHSELSRRKRP
ncbi:helix-hairpin-helix domain-containing protein [Xanthomonas perforans]|uniref:helix-hairpin-helix domain-containing protein n=1 Tax=Xanthomonas perforans TaxID=442694 RepID=UPI00115EE5F5|nr:helix-hairpin-helix domain-containing protein [Xanthomonas perforans]